VGDKARGNDAESLETALRGTTLKVYRHILKQRQPVGVSGVQKALGLSSPSVSQYHIKKLLTLELIREEPDGFVVNRVVLENAFRLRRVSIPTQAAYSSFFGIMLLILLTFLRPGAINSVYFFAIVINVVALLTSVYEALKTLRRL